jgi:predicted nucleic acid-binding protein
VASYFFDSGALVKRYVNESGTVWVTSLIDPVAGHEIFLARLSGVEVLSAIKRRERIGTLSPQDAQAAISNFRKDFAAFFTLLDISTLLISQAMSLAERSALRGYDAVQLAAALEVHRRATDLGLSRAALVSSDQALNEAGLAEGLTVENPNRH